MRLIRNLKEIGGESTHTIVVITGNGKTEGYILTALCPKYNGQGKYLWFPAPPRRKKVTGLKALNSVCEHRRSNHDKFLFLVDRIPCFEGIAQGNEQEQVCRYLEKLKIRIEATDELARGRAFVLRGYLGGHSLKIWTAIQGRTRLEDEMSDLIRLKFGEEVKPEKGEIRNFVKRKYPNVKGEKYYQALLKSASKKYLEQAFPGLCSVLKRMEKE